VCADFNRLSRENKPVIVVSLAVASLRERDSRARRRQSPPSRVRARATQRAPRRRNAATPAPCDRIAARTQSTASARATPARTDANANAEAAANAAHDDEVVARRPVRPRAEDAGAAAAADDASHARSRVAIMDSIVARVSV